MTPVFSFTYASGETIVGFRTSEKNMTLAVFHPDFSDGYRETAVLFPMVEVQEQAGGFTAQARLDFAAFSKARVGRVRERPPVHPLNVSLSFKSDEEPMIWLSRELPPEKNGRLFRAGGTSCVSTFVSQSLVYRNRR